MGNKHSKKVKKASTKNTKETIGENETLCIDFDHFLGIYNSFKLPVNPGYKRRLISTHFHEFLNQFITISSTDPFSGLEVMVFDFTYKAKKQNKIKNLQKSFKINKTYYIQCDVAPNRCRSHFYEFHPKYLYLFIIQNDKGNQLIKMYDLNNQLQNESINAPNIIFKPMLTNATKYNQCDEYERNEILNSTDDPRAVVNCQSILGGQLIESIKFINYKDAEYLLINGSYGYIGWIMFKFDYKPVVPTSNQLQTTFTENVYFFSDFSINGWGEQCVFQNENAKKYLNKVGGGGAWKWNILETNVGNKVPILLVLSNRRLNEPKYDFGEIIYVEFNLDKFEFEWNPVNGYKGELIMDHKKSNTAISYVKFLQSADYFVFIYRDFAQRPVLKNIRLYKQKETNIDNFINEVVDYMPDQVKFSFVGGNSGDFCKCFNSNRYGDICVVGYGNYVKVIGENPALMHNVQTAIYNILGQYLNNVVSLCKVIIDMIGININSSKMITLPCNNEINKRSRSRFKITSISWCQKYDTMFVSADENDSSFIYIYSTPS